MSVVKINFLGGVPPNLDLPPGMEHAKTHLTKAFVNLTPLSAAVSVSFPAAKQFPLNGFANDLISCATL
jgi:hypothetical protein